jgi:hypothetical protein
MAVDAVSREDFSGSIRLAMRRADPRIASESATIRQENGRIV